jgi:hypothetical protein
MIIVTFIEPTSEIHELINHNEEKQQLKYHKFEKKIFILI